MLFFVLCVIFHLYDFSSSQNSTETLFLNTTRGKTYHTEDEILRLILVPKISRGQPATLGEIPYQVSLKTPTPQSQDIFYTFCGASILSPTTLLSAAHCFIPKDESLYTRCLGRVSHRLIKTAFAVAGNLVNFARFSPQDSVYGGQWRRIAEVHFPSSYNFPKDDISVLTLRRPFIFNNNIKPIRIAQSAKEYGGLQCLASGYGKLAKHDRSPNLRKAVVEVLPVRTCDILFHFRTQKLVCTTDRVADVLEGDSGGPLVCKNTNDPADIDGKGVQVGVVSGGITGTGSLFTRVTAYKNYIARGRSNLIMIERLIVWVILLLRLIAFCGI